MKIEKTKTTDPKTGKLTSITVKWDEGLHYRKSERLIKLALLFILPAYVYVTDVPAPDGSSILPLLLMFAFILSGVVVFPLLQWPRNGFFPERRFTTLKITDAGTLHSNTDGFLLEGGVRLSETSFGDVLHVQIDNYTDWVRKSSVTENNKDSLIDLMLVILMRTDGRPVFLSMCNYPRAVLQAVFIAISQSLEEMKPYIASIKTPRT